MGIISCIVLVSLGLASLALKVLLSKFDNHHGTFALVNYAHLELTNWNTQSHSSSDPREVLRKIFREPTVGHYPQHSWSPVTPSRLWPSIAPCPNLICTPSPAIFNRFPTTGHGRVINTARLNWEPKVFAMLSLRKEVSRISPHPGVRPPELDEFVHPWYVTTDGSLGPYDASRYAQTFDPHRLWTGFHKFLSSPPMREHVEDYNTVTFFDFRDVNEETMLGGSWKLDMLNALFCSRTDAEDAFLKTLSEVGDANGEMLLAHFGSSLPFFDLSSFDGCRMWNSWLDGRDAIGYTRRYIHELNAMRCWLIELKRQADHPGTAAVIGTGYSGTWVGTIDNEENWNFFMNSPLPLFGLFTINHMHPLYSKAVRGSLDNEEFVRMDPVVHNLPSYFPTPYDKDYPLTSFHRPLNCALEVTVCSVTLPPTLTVIPPGETLEVACPAGYPYPYTTYLFNDSKILRSGTTDVPSPRQKSLNKRLERIAKATTRPHLPPALAGAMTVARLPFHPITAVLPPRPFHDKKRRTFLEENISVIFYPEPVSKKQLKNYEQFYQRSHTYDLGNNDFLLTDWPWPCPNDVQLGRGEDHEDIERNYLPYIDPSDPKRVYVRREPPEVVLDKLPDIDIRPPTFIAADPNPWEDDDVDLLDLAYEPGSGLATPLAHQPMAGISGLGSTPPSVISFSAMKFIAACRRDHAESDNSGPCHRSRVPSSPHPPRQQLLVPSVSTIHP